MLFKNLTYKKNYCRLGSNFVQGLPDGILVNWLNWEQFKIWYTQLTYSATPPSFSKISL